MQLRPTSVRSPALSRRDFQHRYAPVITGFAREIGILQQDAVALAQDVFRAMVIPHDSLDPQSTCDSFRVFLRKCTLGAMRRRLSGREREFAWQWEEFVSESKAIERIWDEAWEEQLVPRALSAVRAHLDDDMAFRAFWRRAVMGEDAQIIAGAMGLSEAQVRQSSNRVRQALTRNLLQIRREEG